MDQTTYIIIGIALLLVIFMGGTYYLRHVKTSPKKIEKSGIDINQLLTYLGGQNNVTKVSANGSKVIFGLKDTRKIDSEGIKSLGASGIVSGKDKVTIIFGRVSDALANEVGQIL